MTASAGELRDPDPGGRPGRGEENEGMRRGTRFLGAVLGAAALCLAATAVADDIVVADATDLQALDDGVVYRITEEGDLETVAFGPPLQSPAGILFDGRTEEGDTFFVSDLGTFFGLDDGAVLKVGDGVPTEVVYAGPPLSSPFGMVRMGDVLYVADYGDPQPGLLDGALFALDLDPDGDGEDGPFPLAACDLRTIWAGPPLGGPNQMVWDEGNRLLMADDEGVMFRIDPRREGSGPVAFGPAFVDPVGLARLTSRSGFLLVDPHDASIWWVDRHGEGKELLLSGSIIDDQFLGAGLSREGWAAVCNAGDLFSPGLEDGSVVLLDETGVGVAWSGPPLQNPMGLQVVGRWKHPRKK